MNDHTSPLSLCPNMVDAWGLIYLGMSHVSAFLLNFHTAAKQEVKQEAQSHVTPQNARCAFSQEEGTPGNQCIH